MDLLGRVLDEKYRIDRHVSGGGMGTVFAATHVGTERRVAVKVIAPQLMSSPEFIERFRREAKAAGRLRHPNVVNVTDFGFAAVDGERMAYLVMEYLDGCTLAEVLAEEKRLSPVWVADIVDQICAGVESAHQMGVIHRDLKPENIWVSPDGRGGYAVKVFDFGLAKLSDASERASENMVRTSPGLEPEAFSAQMATKVATEAATVIQPMRPTNGTASGAVTHAGTILGTPLYMSPEQCRGDAPDARSDIYGLGVVVYQMLTGTTPFVGDMSELMRLHRDEPPPPVRNRQRKIPRAAARVVMSALEKDPARRPQTASAFASGFRANVEGVGPLLRRAVAFYGQHFQTFLQISFIVTLPLLMFKGCRSTIDAVDAERWDPEIFHISISTFSFNMSVWGVPETVMELFVTPLLTFGAFASVTAQLAVAPLRAVKLQSVFHLLKRRLRPFLATAALYYVCLTVGYALCVVPGLLVSFGFLLYPMIVIMEPTQGWSALRRSWSLVNRIRKTALIVTTLNLLASMIGSVCLQIAFQGLESLFKYERTGDEYSLKFYFQFGVKEEFVSALIGIAVGPLLGIVSAMLYFKARQAGGETLSETLAEFEAANFPRAKWREKMDAASGST
jgi:serine/threonine protein kinase